MIVVCTTTPPPPRPLLTSPALTRVVCRTPSSTQINTFRPPLASRLRFLQARKRKRSGRDGGDVGGGRRSSSGAGSSRGGGGGGGGVGNLGETGLSDDDVGSDNDGSDSNGSITDDDDDVSERGDEMEMAVAAFLSGVAQEDDSDDDSDGGGDGKDVGGAEMGEDRRPEGGGGVGVGGSGNGGNGGSVLEEEGGGTRCFLHCMTVLRWSTPRLIFEHDKTAWANTFPGNVTSAQFQRLCICATPCTPAVVLFR